MRECFGPGVLDLARVFWAWLGCFFWGGSGVRQVMNPLCNRLTGNRCSIRQIQTIVGESQTGSFDGPERKWTVRWANEEGK